ncbi:Mitochondrial import inner membrane translocase subunit tim22 [Exophiala xenobiotica]|uniref:Mitochondrial import inner membrane translocase subunit TIM22 n=1 Tax=Vermiconidia calcicola TaxID=1690605 RepID=A0AAV9QD92_9PEZI|nr:Mitochondrial import inner membrane translocase subunit tim22 [Exophiala xenobiotica]KAK5541115.1 Mitochondrial import inner membrane translocase subunit tim22 [Vermiconidia calcicola]KAK5549392.1 Mitochondrial import inner membrane translocase subunit tim22 [Chaetothyriales sp. CCFEE 6169]KAK5222802.1 Mitochondrial import inner membrane translocase subunit tim22 [Exophiala xenobiotica]KAK5237033.1 Mitochondrial import inner membrane translocase subunit tim22 [Exophiala xenobiotica]
MSFPGMYGGPGAGGAGSSTAGMNEQEQKMVKMMSGAMESCLAKSIMAGAMGGVLGGAFGLFMSSMAYDTPLSPQGQQITSLPVREQLKRGLKDMGAKSWSSAKNFAMIGGIYSGVECTIEGFRAKSDLKNSALAGCITGAGLAYKAGPQAVLLGCGGFAAFSTAIDAYMRMPESD